MAAKRLLRVTSGWRNSRGRLKNHASQKRFHLNKCGTMLGIFTEPLKQSSYCYCGFFVWHVKGNVAHYVWLKLHPIRLCWTRPSLPQSRTEPRPRNVGYHALRDISSCSFQFDPRSHLPRGFMAGLIGNRCRLSLPFLSSSCSFISPDAVSVLLRNCEWGWW